MEKITTKFKIFFFVIITLYTLQGCNKEQQTNRNILEGKLKKAIMYSYNSNDSLIMMYNYDVNYGTDGNANSISIYDNDTLIDQIQIVRSNNQIQLHSNVGEIKIFLKNGTNLIDSISNQIDFSDLYSITRIYRNSSNHITKLEIETFNSQTNGIGQNEIIDSIQYSQDKIDSYRSIAVNVLNDSTFSNVSNTYSLSNSKKIAINSNLFINNKFDGINIAYVNSGSLMIIPLDVNILDVNYGVTSQQLLNQINTINSLRNNESSLQISSQVSDNFIIQQSDTLSEIDFRWTNYAFEPIPTSFNLKYKIKNSYY